MKKIMVIGVFLFWMLKLSAQCGIITSEVEICENNTAILKADGGGSYLWSTGETTDSIVVSPKESCIYTVKIGCGDTLITDTATVVVHKLPELNLGEDREICYGETIELIANDAEGYLWSTGEITKSIEVAPKLTTDYWVLITDKNSCQNSDTISIKVNNLPVVELLGKSTLCQGDSTLLTVNSNGQKYSWNTGDTTQMIAVSPYETSIYIVTVYDENKCSNSDSLKIVVYNNPIADFSFDTVCSGTSTHFIDMSKDSINNIISRSWVFDNIIFSEQNNPSYTFGDGGVYDIKLVIKSDKGCKDSVEHSVLVEQSPVSSFYLPAEYACDYPYLLQPINNSRFSNTYLWYKNSDSVSNTVNPVIEVDSVGDYEIKLIAQNDKCADTSTKLFRIYPKPVISYAVEPNVGCEPLNVHFINNTKYADSVVWFFAGKTVSDTMNFNAILNYGVYDIKIAAYNRYCSDVTFQKDYITVHKKPLADFDYEKIEDPYFYGLVEFYNYSQYANKYYWDFGDSTSSFEFDGEHRYYNFDTITVTLRAIDSITGCADTLSKVLSLPFWGGLYIPTAFMPESRDESYKYFKPVGINLMQYNIKVFDRWGTLLWESSSLNNGMPSESWDGRYRGKLLPAGMYYWSVDAIFVNGEKWKGQKNSYGVVTPSGYVYLIR